VAVFGAYNYLRLLFSTSALCTLCQEIFICLQLKMMTDTLCSEGEVERREEMLELVDSKTFERYMWWILHQHTPTTFVTYFNNAVVTIEYCNGCHKELYRDVRGVDLPLDKDKIP
jgi:hypothetical protein